MKQKILKTTHETIESYLDGLNLQQAIEFLQKTQDRHLDKEIVIKWEQESWSDDYQLNLYERRDETEGEESTRELEQERQRQIQLEYKRLQLEKLKKELGEE